MKRMKNLLALVMAIVMVLALAIPAFAIGDIKVAEAGTHTYKTYKVFNLDPSDPDNYQYTFVKATGDKDNALLAFLQSYPDLILTETTPAGTYTVKKTNTYSAADFAAKLAEALAANNDLFSPDRLVAITTTTGTTPNEIIANDVADGYYFITYNNGQPYALTTVDGKDVQIQNKHDTPFDKDVYKAEDDRTARTPSHNEKSVELGDTLYYQITGKVVDAGENTQYNYVVWDKLSKGQKLNLEDAPYNGTVKVYLQPIDTTTTNYGAPTGARKEITDRFTIDTVNTTPVTSTPKDTIWINTTVPADADAEVYTDTTPTFVVNIDMKGLNDYMKKAVADGGLGYTTLDYAIIIEYNATVLEDVGVIDNTAHLVSNDLIKDAQTRNYVNEIVVDKFETGNASQKLAGAEFVLFKVVEDSPATGTPGDPGYVAAVTHKEYYSLHDGKVEWVRVDDQATEEATIANLTSLAMETVPNGNTTNITKAVTTTDGSAHFVGLEDGTYNLYEIKAPNGYVRLETPVEIEVNGKASLDPNNVVDDNAADTKKNQLVQLRNVSHVANTPGSVLPSTGGRGTTMLYMAGLGMMLAAGAFLIFRRRAEAGK